MPRPLTPDEMADKLLLEWAARKAASESRNPAEVLREDGILTAARNDSIRTYEVPFSAFEREEND